MVAEALLSLPQYVVYEGAQFEYQLFKNGHNELRLSYFLEYTDPQSPHFLDFKQNGAWDNPFLDSYCSFLFLVQGIENDEDLLAAIKATLQFLKHHNLISL